MNNLAKALKQKRDEETRLSQTKLTEPIQGYTVYKKDRHIYASTGTPDDTVGADGDIWIQY